MTLNTNKTTGDTIEAVEWNESATAANNVNQDVRDTASPSFESVKIATTDGSTWVSGQIHYEEGISSVIVDLDENGIHAPLVENTFKVKNESGDTINKLTVVTPTGATGNNPTVTLADASDFTKINPVGLIRSETIANNAVGYVTTFGRMSHTDTSAWSEGDLLYLSATTPGAMTNVKPSYPNYPVRIGVVARSHASEGSVIVDSAIVHDIDQDLSTEGTPSFVGITNKEEYDFGDSGTTFTADFSNGQKGTLDLTGNVTLTLSAPGVGSYLLRLVQDATGSRAVTWANIENSTAPDIVTDASGETLVPIYYNGTGFYAYDVKVE